MNIEMPVSIAYASVQEFVAWVANNRAYNGSNHAHGQSLYNECVNAALPEWVKQWVEEKRAEEWAPLLGPQNHLLTSEERLAIDLSAQLANLLVQVVGDGPTREQDLAELLSAIHVIQRAVMAQAAASVYPEDLRRLGEGIPGDADDG